MELTRRLVAVLVLLSVCRDVFSAETASSADDKYNVLLERIKALEARDVAKDVKIAEMELKFELKEGLLMEQINRLKEALVKSGGVDKEPDDNTREDNNVPSPVPSKIKRQSNQQDVRAAFYATHVDHDVHHLGQNQPLPFQHVITNIGHAYNNMTGAFVAPIDGTYAFHATILGIDVHQEQASHYHAHIDVDGTQYSRFWITAGDQASQMLVIALKAGQTVTVRNDFPDTGFVGQHYSTFSGFLLCKENSEPIFIGK